jgi:hypothetical protein
MPSVCPGGLVLRAKEKPPVGGFLVGKFFRSRYDGYFLDVTGWKSYPFFTRFQFNEKAFLPIFILILREKVLDFSKVYLSICGDYLYFLSFIFP